jgi:ankyrin repeat protein
VSTDSPETPRALPDRPNLRHLKGQAKDLLHAGVANSITDAQFQVARRYGFSSWPALKAHVEALGVMPDLELAADAEDVERIGALMSRHPSLQGIVERLHGVGTWLRMKTYVAAQSIAGRTASGQLKRAIDLEDLDRVKALMTADPGLHRAPIGYGDNGPLTWVAECRVPWRPPSAARLAIAAWMIDHGSDVHQGGDGPLMRAALNGDRVPMMALLVAKGADVNAVWNGTFPIIFAPCETVDPVALRWLLDHGANPNCSDPAREFTGTALDYLIGSYARSTQLGACIEMLVAAGGTARCNVPVVFNLLSGGLDRVRDDIEADRTLVTRRFPDLDFGASGGRLLTLRGTTLLHVAAEYRNAAAVQFLLDCGADVNGRALVDDAGLGGQTAIFHAVTQNDDGGESVVRLLLDRGADLSVRVKVPGHYERPGEVIECTPLGYVLGVADNPQRSKTIALLRERNAPT